MIRPDDLPDCLESLNDAEARARIRQVSPTHKDSFEWLFSDKVPFVKWLSDVNYEFSPIFWITGKPGSGKSTIMRFAMQDPRLLDLLPNGQGKPVGYFFNLRGKNIIQKSLKGMLHELVFQLLSQFPAFFECVKPIYRSMILEKRQRRPEWDVPILKQCLMALCSLTTKSRVRNRFILFIDALDENENSSENNEVLSIVKELAESFDTSKSTASGNILKICLASRPWPIFQKELGNDLRIPNFAIHDLTKRDIEAYTLSLLSSAFSEVETRSGSENWATTLAEMVTKKAHGVFIWVRIVVEELCRNIIDGSPNSTLEDYLTDLPAELHELYEYTMKRIVPKYSLETLVACRILLYSLSPLTLETLYCATTACILGSYQEVPRSSQLAWLRSRTGGLIEIVEAADQGPDQEPTVQLIHQTVQEFVHNHMPGLPLESLNQYWLKLDGNFLIYRAITAHHPPPAPAQCLAKDLFRYLRSIDITTDKDPESISAISLSLRGWLLQPSPTIFLRSHWEGGILCSVEDLLDYVAESERARFSSIVSGLAQPRPVIRSKFVRGLDFSTVSIPETLYDSTTVSIRETLYDPRVPPGVLSLILHDVYHGALWDEGPSSPSSQQYKPWKSRALFIAALGPRISDSGCIDRVRMVRKVIDAYGDDIVNHPIDLECNSQTIQYSSQLPTFELMMGNCNPFVVRNNEDSTSLLEYLVIIEQHPEVNEDTRLLIAEALLSHGALPDFSIRVLHSHLDAEYAQIPAVLFCGRFKSKKWVHLLQRYSRMVSCVNWTDLILGATLTGDKGYLRRAKDQIYASLESDDLQDVMSTSPGLLLGGLVVGAPGCPSAFKSCNISYYKRGKKVG